MSAVQNDALLQVSPQVPRLAVTEPNEADTE